MIPSYYIWYWISIRHNRLSFDGIRFIIPGNFLKIIKHLKYSTFVQRTSVCIYLFDIYYANKIFVINALHSVSYLINTTWCIVYLISRQPRPFSPLSLYQCKKEQKSQSYWENKLMLGIMQFFTIRKSDAFLSDYLTDLSVTSVQNKFWQKLPPVGFEPMTSWSSL